MFAEYCMEFNIAASSTLSTSYEVIRKEERNWLINFNYFHLHLTSRKSIISRAFIVSHNSEANASENHNTTMFFVNVHMACSVSFWMILWSPPSSSRTTHGGWFILDKRWRSESWKGIHRRRVNPYATGNTLVKLL